MYLRQRDFVLGTARYTLLSSVRFPLRAPSLSHPNSPTRWNLSSRQADSRSVSRRADWPTRSYPAASTSPSPFHHLSRLALARGTRSGMQTDTHIRVQSSRLRRKLARPACAGGEASSSRSPLSCSASRCCINTPGGRGPGRVAMLPRRGGARPGWPRYVSAQRRVGNSWRLPSWKIRARGRRENKALP